MNTNEKGNMALGKAIAYFTKEGYCVSIPLNDSQPYDLVVEKDNVLQTVQVKYTSEKRNENVYICTLVTTSGSSRQKIYSLTDTKVNLLFCMVDKGICFLIPISDINTTKTISLYTTKDSVNNRATLNTYQYIVE